ncbi:hypothetical protein SSS_08805 [Sarcoptes scabiei]|nr:hypothetical protein SSS_08805 [Sarcoptes scabiei]
MNLNKPGPSKRHIGSNLSSSDHNISESHLIFDPIDYNQSQSANQKDRNSVFNAIPSQNLPNNIPFNPYNIDSSSFGANFPNNAWTTPASTGQQPSLSAPVQSMMNNQQFLMAAGQHLLSNPMTAAAIDAYSQSLVDKSKGWLGNLKQYFAVDTNYTVKKLLLIFIPFLHKDWSIRYNSENVTPKDEPNLPDLYIPSMAFITYILVSGYILGLKNQFAPEKLSIYASSALVWLLLEVLLIFIAKYILNLSSTLNFLHMLAFGGYKFVSIDLLLVLSILFGPNVYSIFFSYLSISLGYFLVTSISQYEFATKPTIHLSKL